MADYSQIDLAKNVLVYLKDIDGAGDLTTADLLDALASAGVMLYPDIDGVAATAYHSTLEVT